MNLKNALIMAFGVALLGSTSALHASDAVLVQKSGTVTVTLPNGSSKELSQGDMIPEGSTVKTSADGMAFVEPAAGIVATLAGDTTVKVAKIQISQDSSGTVTKQDVLLDLEQGNLTSTLDPEKRAVNDYKVKTPKGVAAARGTGFVCNVTINTGTTIAVTSDGVTYSTGGSTITIVAGYVTYTPAGGSPVTVSIASLASQGAANLQTAHIQAMLADAVVATSSVVANNIGGLGTSGATTLLTEVVGAASAANPSQAVAFAAAAASAATAPGSATASVGNQVAADVAAAAAAADPAAAGKIAATVVKVTGGSSAVAGTVAAAVSSATGQSTGSIAASIVTQNPALTTTAITQAATTAASTTTITTQAQAVSANVTNITTIVTPLNVSTVSPSG